MNPKLLATDTALVLHLGGQLAYIPSKISHCPKMRDPDYVRLDLPLISRLRWKERPNNWPEKTDIVWKKFVVPQDVSRPPTRDMAIITLY